jgi:hypothetical protein
LEVRALVGYLCGPKPHINLLVDWIGSSWVAVARGKFRVTLLLRGFFSFLFETPMDKEVVYKVGPWSYESSMLVLVPLLYSLIPFGLRRMNL